MKKTAQIDFDIALSQIIESMKVYTPNSYCKWCDAFGYKQEIINCNECPIRNNEWSEENADNN